MGLAEVGRIAGVSRASVTSWRRSLHALPAPAGGTQASPVFDRRAVVAWLLEHGKLHIPTTPPAATVRARSAGGRTPTVRFDDPLLCLADDAEGTDRLSGWVAEDDAETLDELGEGAYGMTMQRVAVPGLAPLAVMGEVQVSGRARPTGGRCWLELSWPSRVRGTADSASGVVRHGVVQSGPAPGKGAGAPGTPAAPRRRDPLRGAGTAAYGVARLAVTPPLRPALGNRRSETLSLPFNVRPRWSAAASTRGVSSSASVMIMNRGRLETSVW